MLEIISEKYKKHHYGQNRWMVKCRCECGNSIELRHDFVNKKVKSCGCLYLKILYKRI